MVTVPSKRPLDKTVLRVRCEYISYVWHGVGWGPPKRSGCCLEPPEGSQWLFLGTMGVLPANKARLPLQLPREVGSGCNAIPSAFLTECWRATRGGQEPTNTDPTEHRHLAHGPDSHFVSAQHNRYLLEVLLFIKKICWMCSVGNAVYCYCYNGLLFSQLCGLSLTSKMFSKNSHWHEHVSSLLVTMKKISCSSVFWCSHSCAILNFMVYYELLIIEK